MATNIEFFFDIVSPYSYLASTQMRGLEERTATAVRWRPFFLGGVMQAVGNRPPAELAPRGRYMLTDLLRWARQYEVPFRMPSRFPLNSITAQRMLSAADAGSVPALAGELFKAYWVHDQDITDHEVLRACAEAAGLSGDSLLEASTQTETKATLRAVTDEAVSRGVFGAPTFFIGDEMFFGNDRIEFVERAARGER